MQEIAHLLQRHRVPFFDKKLSWGALASDYSDEIAGLPPGSTPVAVELIDDMPSDWVDRTRFLWIDHHGARVSDRCSLRQVFELLERPETEWTRRYQLVEANDIGHVAALKRMGATLDEMICIRADDRVAQGITQRDETAGLLALQSAESLCNTTCVTLPHNKMATVTDPLALNKAFADLPQSVLIRAPGEIGYFGDGHIAQALAKHFPAGWFGGNPPKTGFWGISATGEDQLKLYMAALKVISAAS